MRGRPSPVLPLVAALLLVPMILGGSDGSASPYRPAASEPNQPRAAPPLSPPLLVAAPHARFADLVVGFDPGDDGAARASRTAALGAPDHGSVGLGRAGCIVLAFTDLVLHNDPAHRAPDLRLHMHDDTLRESAWLSVSLDGAAYDDYGEIGGDTGDIDLSERIALPEIRYLRFHDLGNNVYSGTNPHSGWDLDAVEALRYDEHLDPTLGLVRDTGVRTLVC